MHRELTQRSLQLTDDDPRPGGGGKGEQLVVLQLPGPTFLVPHVAGSGGGR